MSAGAYLAADRVLAVAQHAELPEAALGAALFADISGFTPLTESLARELGPRAGAEELTRHLNTVYSRLIALIHSYGGSVIGFSGDAVTCWFAAEDAPLRLTSLRAVTCAWALQQAMVDLPALRVSDEVAINLSLKVAVTSGAARRFLVGDPQHQQIDVLAGATVARLADAQEYARSGEVIVDSASARLIEGAAPIAGVHSSQADQAGFAVLAGPPISEVIPTDTWQLPAIDAAVAARFLPPAVAARLRGDTAGPPTELRPVVALLLRFGELDYDGDPRAPARLDRFIRRVQAVLARYDGTFLQLTTGDKGSYLYAAFGAPMTHENDEERAMYAALDLLALPADLGFVGRPQIGISRGMMRTGLYGGSGRLTYGALGDAVNTAARLMQAVAPGQVFVSAAAQQAVAARFLWTPLPPLPVKGKSAPLQAFQLVAAHPRRTAGFYQGSVVGRDAELARLAASVTPIFAGQFAGVCYVNGEAGVGKSRLVYETRRRLAAQTSITWMYCPSDGVLRDSLRPFATWLGAYFEQSPEHGENENRARFDRLLYTLIAELSDDETRTTDRAQLAAELDRTRSFLGALIGLRWDGSLYEQLDPKLRFENTLLALTALIRAESLRRPVWLELEDAHWLDEDSQTLVTSLSQALSGFPVLIVCAARLDDEGRPFALPLADGTAVSSIDLETLTYEGIGALVAQALAGPADAELVRFVYDRTGGNPFFAEQLLLDLRERGLITHQEPGVARRSGASGGSLAAPGVQLAVDVPDTLNKLLVARLDRLAVPVREVVQMAAVIGREWPLPILAAMRAGDDDLLPKVRAAEDGRIWSPIGERDYLFRHVLLRDAAYGMQLQQQRRELHLRAAQAIAQEYAENLASQYSALVYHYREAGDREQERHYARLAGEAAALRYANAEAITFLSRALELSAEDNLAERYTLLLAREQVYDLRGNSEGRAHDLAALDLLADTLDDDGLRAEVAVRRSRYAEASSDYPLAVAAAGQAAALAEKSGLTSTLVRAYRQWGWSLVRQGQYDAARPLTERSLSYARTIGDRAGESQALYDLGGGAMYQGDLAAAGKSFAESLELARQAGDRRLESQALNAVGSISRELSDYTAQQKMCEQSLRLNREIGNRRGEALAVLWQGVLGLDFGDYQAARAAYEQSLELCRAIPDRYLECSLLINLAQIAHLSGDNVAAMDQARAALQIAESIGIEHLQSHALTFLGHALAVFGELDQAEAVYARAYELRQRNGERMLMLEAQAFLANVALLRGDPAGALSRVTPLLELLIDGDGLEAVEERMRDYLIVYRVLSAAQDSRADTVLRIAYAFLQEQAAKLPDERSRRIFLENVPHHRELLAAWEAGMGKAAPTTLTVD